MNFKQITGTLLLAWILIPALSKAQNSAALDSIDVFLESTMKERHIPALQLAVIREGKIVKLRNYGLANLENSIPTKDESVFTINSVTKAFVGVAIMQLVEEGKLKIEDPISLYIDSLPAEWQKITLQQVLTHISGLPEITDAKDQMLGDGTEDSAWKQVKTLPLAFKTGDRFMYNQTGYVILGKIITKLSGIHFTKFIEDRQFKAAKMNLTRFGDSYDVIPNSAGNYTLDKLVGDRYVRTNTLGIAYREFPVFYRTATGIMSTATDLANWIIALQTGKLLKNKSSIEKMWTPAILNNGKIGGFNKLNNGYALGWPTVTREEHPAISPVGGGRAGLFVYPKDDITVIVLTNLMGSNPEQFIDEITAYYLPDMHESNGFGLPAGIRKFRAELLKQGFNKTETVLTSLKKKDSSIHIDEDELNAWGYKLLNNKQTPEALAIFKLNTKLYPKSANTYDSLGEIQELMGDNKPALENYKKSLSLNPQNKNAAARIKVLSGN